MAQGVVKLPTQPAGQVQVVRKQAEVSTEPERSWSETWLRGDLPQRRRRVRRSEKAVLPQGATALQGSLTRDSRTQVTDSDRDGEGMTP